MPEATLKEGWTRVAFGDVVRQVKDKVDPRETSLERYIAGEHVDTDDLKIRRWGLIGNDYLGPAFHMRFKPGRVLYGSRRTYLRKVAVPEFEGITANTTYVLEPKDPKVLLPELLPFIMQTETFHEHSIKQSKGSVNPYVNFSDLTWYEFALPPLEEQRRIARVTWAIEDDSNAYSKIAEQAEAVSISAALELLSLRGVSLARNGARHRLLPGGRWTEGHEIFTAMSGNGEPSPDPNGDSLFLKVADFNRNESERHIARADSRFRASDNVGIRLFAPGTVVFPKRGATIFLNKAGILRVPAALDPNLMALVPRDSKVDPEFLYWCVKCIGLWRLADTTSLPQLNHKHLKPILFPLPKLQEQQSIAARLSVFHSAKKHAERRLSRLRSVKARLLADSLTVAS